MLRSNIRTLVAAGVTSISIVSESAQLIFAATPAAGEPIRQSATFIGPNYEYSKPVASWKTLKQRNVVMQQKEYTCGAASLATLLKFCFDDSISEEIVLEAALGKLSAKELEDRQKNGLSMEDLANAASKLNFAAAVLEMKYDKLRTLKIPVIVRLQHDDFKHFVVFRGELGTQVFLADPLRGNIRHPIERFCSDWDGKVLAVVSHGQKPPPNTTLAIPECQLVTPENEAARQAIIGSPLPPAWVAFPIVR